MYKISSIQGRLIKCVFILKFVLVANQPLKRKEAQNNKKASC